MRAPSFCSLTQRLRRVCRKSSHGAQESTDARFEAALDEREDTVDLFGVELQRRRETLARVLQDVFACLRDATANRRAIDAIQRADVRALHAVEEVELQDRARRAREAAHAGLERLAEDTRVVRLQEGELRILGRRLHAIVERGFGL